MQSRELNDIIDKGIRGGISCISHKHAVANNPLIPDTYDSSKPSSYILYIDMNSLYATAMSCSLPEKNFKLLDTAEVNYLLFLHA
jgi:hypothetical protein